MKSTSRSEIKDKSKADSEPVKHTKNSEKKSITLQDYKATLGKRLYELESESMPAT